MHSNPTRGMNSEGLRHKLWIVYLLMFVLPTGYLLCLVGEISRAAEAGGEPPAATRLALLLGLPAAVVMSAAAFLLLYHSLRDMYDLVRTVEGVLRELKPEGLPPPPSRDEAQQLSHYVSRLIDEFRRHVSAIDRYAEELHAANVQLTDLALVDPLTGLYNRKHAMHMLEIEIQRTVRADGRLSLMLLDVDGLPAFRAARGDDEADGAIRGIAQKVAANVRRVDTVARLDAGRFMVLLLDTGREGAHTAAERVRRSAATWRPKAEQAPGAAAITISIGVATHEGGDAGAEELLQAAENNLLLAQRRGEDPIAGPPWR